MRKRFASAIREGIEAAKRTRYGQEDDPYFQERNQIIWRYAVIAGGGNARLGDIMLEAFDRTWEKLANQVVSQMTPEECAEAARVFKRCRSIWFETTQERSDRLLREEVEGLRADLRRYQENRDQPQG